VPRQLSPCSAPRSGSRRQVSWAPRTTVSQPDCSALALCSRASRPAACFIHPRPGWPGNVARVVFTVVVQGALNVMLEPLGIPTLTACVRAGDLALSAAESGASSAPCLAVCRGILDTYGGRIQAENLPPGDPLSDIRQRPQSPQRLADTPKTSARSFGSRRTRTAQSYNPAFSIRSPSVRRQKFASTINFAPEPPVGLAASSRARCYGAASVVYPAGT
jgi:hypothetical protein